VRLTPPKLATAALRDRRFRWLAAAQVGFVTGEQILVVAVTVSVLDLGGDASAVGFVLAVKGIASVSLLLVGGVWSDRLSRRRTLITMLAVDALAAVIPILVLLRHPSIWPLAVALFVVGAAESFIRPAFNAMLKCTLVDDNRVSGIALMNMCTRLGVIAGPATGTLLATGRGFLAFVVAGVMFSWGALVFRRVREPPWTPVRQRSLLAEASMGFTEAWSRPWLRALLLFSPVSLVLVIGPSQVLLPVMSRDEFGSYAVYGVALTLYGVGGLISNVTMLAWRPRRPGVVAMSSMSLYALVPLALLYAPSVWVLLGCYAVAGFGVETYALIWDVSMYREIPDHLIGRVTSLAWLSTFGVMPFGQAMTGPMTNLVGSDTVLLLAAVLVAVIPPCLLLVQGMAQLRGTRVAGSTR
jgi:MFS family permease